MMKLLHTVKRIFSDKGLLLTLALSLIVLVIFYGKLLLHPFHTYFGASGDGMQIYYETIYHAKFDKEWLQQNSINYPYGESIFFTGIMPLLGTVTKLFGVHGGALSVGLINLMMLFSPVIGALFLYAIFRHLKVIWYFGAFAATGIAFLSPQMLRFGGHYSLAWVFLLPAMFYLLLRFYDYPSVGRSILIGVLVFIAAMTHLYFLAFFIAIAGVYWLVLFVTRDRGFGRIPFVLKHFSLQVILPVVLLETLVFLSDHVHDRTAVPSGFFYYKSDAAKVFFPFGKPYEKIARLFIDPSPDDGSWSEGGAYVGLFAMCGLAVVLIIQVLRLAKGRFELLLPVTDCKPLNIFFWTSLVLLWISFAHPFTGGHEDWLKYAGPLRQFRTIGRFAWVFFYAANIVAVYRLYKLLQSRTVLLHVVCAAGCLVLFTDAVYNIKGLQDTFNNHLPEWDDVQNTLPQDSVFKTLRPDQFQAILPLPYFHIGSENVSRVPPDDSIINCTFLVSLKTGLPLIAVSSARTSLEQTYKMLPLVLEPLRPVPVLADIHDKRPFLLVVRKAKLDTNERLLLSLATCIAKTRAFDLYSLDPAALQKRADGMYANVTAEMNSRKLWRCGEWMSTDSIQRFAFKNFDNLPGKQFSGVTGKDKFNIFFSDSLPNAMPGNYLATFRVNNFTDDQLPKGTFVEVMLLDKDDNPKTATGTWLAITAYLRAIEGKAGLIEIPFTLTKPGQHVRLTIFNFEAPAGMPIYVGDVLIRPADEDVYRTGNGFIIKNNRDYYLPK